METLLRDLRYALRSFARTPGFTAVAVITLALGTGANATVFSFVDALLLRPAGGVLSPGSLVAIYTSDFSSGPYGDTSYPDYLSMAQEATAFSGMAAYHDSGVGLARLDGAAERLRLTRVSGTFFDVLGTRPFLGRAIASADTAAEAAPIVLVSQQIWERSFGSDPAALGRTITIDGLPRTIVGVIPRAFMGLDLGRGADVWAPLPDTRAGGRGDRRLSVVGRLRVGASIVSAQHELSTIAGRLAQAYPETNLGTLSAPGQPRPFTVIQHSRLDPSFRPEVKALSAILLGSVLLVLFIACANIAGLLLSRSAARQREVAVRVALGASRRDLFRQFLTESLVLGLAGGAGGILLALWTADALPSFFPPEPRALLDAHVDARVLAFTISLSLLSGVLFGLAPAMQIVRRSPMDGLRGAGRTAGAARSRGRMALVVTQVSVAVVLLVSSALLVRSLQHSLRADLGFGLREAAVLTVEQPVARTPAQGLAYSDRLVERVRTTPGVSAVTLASALPLSGRERRGFDIEGYERRQGEARELNVLWVESGYFRTLQMPILEGRAFDPRDREGSTPVAIVNDVLARRYFPGGPIGRHLTDSRGTKLEIVGVVPTGKRLSMQDDAVPMVYYAYAQQYRQRMQLIAATPGGAEPVLDTVRTEAAGVDSDVAIYNTATLASRLAEAIATNRLTAALVATCGFIALVLAVVGVYGVIAFAVVRRTQEIGVRVALGATPFQILRLVMRESGIVLGLGVPAGLVAAVGAGRALGSALYGIGGSDFPLLAGVAAALALVATLASLLPARRALAIDPIVALRRD
jgi:putative ABC transport system permease protein